MLEMCQNGLWKSYLYFFAQGICVSIVSSSSSECDVKWMNNSETSPLSGVTHRRPSNKPCVLWHFSTLSKIEHFGFEFEIRDKKYDLSLSKALFKKVLRHNNINENANDSKSNKDQLCEEKTGIY